METYEYSNCCHNCGKAHAYLIPKGTTASEFLANRMCAICGCHVLSQPEKFPTSDKGRVAGL